MKITALKEQVKNSDRVNVFVDTKYSFSLTISEVIDLKVRVGKELDEASLLAFKKASTDGKVRMQTYEWLMNRPHSTRELKDYLRRKKVEAELIDKLVSEFTDKNVVSDERFAEWFTDRAVRKNKSARMTQNELYSKGVKVQISQIDDQAALRSLVAKLAERPRYADQARLIRYLQGKGFSYYDIKEVLSLRGQE